MAGFSRAPSAWKFTFAGINLKDAPDQIQPVQYPMSVNTRAIADHGIRTRPGYEFFFSGAGGGGGGDITGGITAAWFEAAPQNNSNTLPGTVELWDQDNNSLATIEIDGQVLADRDYDRLRVSVNPDSLPADGYLMPYSPQQTGGVGAATWYMARLILDVEFSNGFKTQIYIEFNSGALVTQQTDYNVLRSPMKRKFVKTDYEMGNCKFHWPMATGDFSANGGETSEAAENYWAFFDNKSFPADGTYGNPDPYDAAGSPDGAGLTVWKYEPSKYSTLSAIVIEATLAMSTSDPPPDNLPVNTGGVGYIALFDKTAGNTIVASTETTFINTVPDTLFIDVPLTDLIEDHEYWIQYALTTPGEVEPNIGVSMYNVMLCIYTTQTSAAKVPMALGDYVGGHGSADVFSTTVRTLFEGSKFTTGTIYTMEISGQANDGTGCDVSMLIAGNADVGFPLVEKYPTTATIVTGAWMDVPHALGGFVNSAWLTLDIALATGILEFGDCGFVAGDFPVGAQINSVSVLLESEGIVGQPSRWTTYARISGVDENLHNGVFHENDNFINPSPPPTSLTINSSESFNLTNDRVWVVADFDDAAFVVRVRANQLNNTTPTTFFLGGIENAVAVRVGYGTDLVDSATTVDSPAGTQARFVSDPVLPVDDIRYILHFTSDSGNNIRHSMGLLVAEVVAP